MLIDMFMMLWYYPDIEQIVNVGGLSMKRWLSGLLILCCILPFFSSCNKKDSVVIYSSMEDYRNDALRKQLRENFPEIDITVQQLSTGNNAAKIKAEGTQTEADIVLGLETAAFEQIIDNFASLSEFPQDIFLDEYKSLNERYIYWEKADGTFVVNTRILEDKGLPEPKNFKDLLKPEYAGLIAMPSPKTSNTGYMFLNAWVNMMGEDEAFNYMDRLQVNIKQFTESGSGPINMLNQGEIAVALGMMFQAADQITQGKPLKIVIPEEGCPYNTTAAGIIKGKETKESVKDVFAYLSTEAIRYDKENFVPGKILKDQATYLKNYPESFKAADCTTVGDTTLKQRLIERWKYS